MQGKRRRQWSLLLEVDKLAEQREELVLAVSRSALWEAPQAVAGAEA